MHRRTRVLAVGGVFLAAAAGLFVAGPGSVVVFDAGQQVASAQLVDGWGHRQPLQDLGFSHVGVPKIEGVVQIVCKNGKVIDYGYVTPRLHTWAMDALGRCRATETEV